MENNISWSLRQLIGKENFWINHANGYRLVIKGPPGAGKTTLGLHILHHHLPEERIKPTISHSLTIYFDEKRSEFDMLANQFGLDFKNNLPDSMHITQYDIGRHFSDIRKWVLNRRDSNISPLCILIDGITILRGFDDKLYTDNILELFTIVSYENVLLIILAEESFEGTKGIYEYMSDAVINLTIAEGSQRHRFLEIEKMRYMSHLRGRHGFEIYDHFHSNRSSLGIYPRTLNVTDRIELAKECSNDTECKRRYFSGIKGLDQIITGKPIHACFEPGHVMAVTVEPGIEKIRMGLSFLKPVLESCSHTMAVSEVNMSNGAHSSTLPPAALQGSDSLNHMDGKFEASPGINSLTTALWLSFSDDAIYKPFTDNTFQPTEYPASGFLTENKIIHNAPEHLFEYIRKDDSAIHPDRMTYHMMRTLHSRRDSLTRLVVNGISSLESEFIDSLQVSNYIVRLSRLIRNSNAIGLLFIDLSSAFKSISSIDMSWGEAVDFIGHLRWYEVGNELITAFSLSKSRNLDFISRPHKVGLPTPDENSGWISLEDCGLKPFNIL